MNIWRDRYSNILTCHDGGEVFRGPFLTGFPVGGSVNYDEGAVEGNVAQKLQRGGFRGEEGDGGGVERVIGCYEILNI
jgi:hypothetical protein